MSLPLRDYFQLLERYLRPQGRLVGLLAFCIFAGIGFQLWLPQIVRSFIDIAQQGAATSVLLQTGVIYLVATLINQAVRLGAAYVTEDVKWRATNWLRNDLSAHCMALDMRFHHEHTPGSMIERIDTDVNKLSEFFSQFVLRLFANGLLMVGVLVMLSLEDWHVGLAFALFALITFAILMSTVRLGAHYFVQERAASADLYGGLEEWLAGTEDIRANGGVAYVLDRMQRFIYKVYITSRRAYAMGTLNWGITSLLFALSLALALGLGVWYMHAGVMTIGTVYLIVSYSNTLQRPVTQLARQFQDMQAATASIIRIRELFALEPTVKSAATPERLPTGALSVRFDEVSFGYADDTPVLREVDFDLEAGKVLGLLGRTGSGKTTITRMLFRFYDPSSGEIELGGHDLRALDLNDVRRSVGMVTQDVQLFQASVRDNLTFFDHTIPDEKIIDALHTLGLTRWYESLEHGLDTRLEAGGRSLSAGEAQLLAFTRVFLKDPGLVILDEASSRLDPVTEHLIEEAIDHLLAGRTAIIVAHRLATVQRADKILVLGDGQVLEFGDRIALLANPNSRFSQLMRTGMAEVLV
ncbi:MAG: ABC transporter ATP-binding protein [Caldilineaceae bacterium]